MCAGAPLVRDGSWLTSDRLRVYPRIFLFFYVLAALGMIATTDARGLDLWGRPLGTDFSNVWSAGVLTLEGHPADAYDPAAHHEAQKRLMHEPEVPFYGWHYPPMFLMVAAGLGLFPYVIGLGLWMALTLPAYLWVMRRLLDRPELTPLALAFPAVFVCLGHGQNAFFTTALLGGVFLAMDRDRPWLAGLLLGFLTYKPQFGMLFPLVLLVGWHPRIIAGAVAGLAVTAGLSTAWFGPEIWSAFRESGEFTRAVVLEIGGTGWQKIGSVFSAFRMHGASLPVAYAAQWTSFGAAAAINAWMWWYNRGVSLELRASALTIGLLLSTPYYIDYDLVILAVPLVMIARLGLKDGFLPWEKSMLAALWVLPLVTRMIAGAARLPISPILLWVALLLILHRARLEVRGGVASGGSRATGAGAGGQPAPTGVGS